MTNSVPLAMSPCEKASWIRRARSYRTASLLAISASIALLVGSVGATSTLGATYPPYEGAMTFPPIQGPSDPEEFSWEVQLSPEQALEAIDDQHAEVYYAGDHHVAFGITAEAAHDADGSSVPTTLTVTQPNIVTLIVQHRSGSLATGEPFAYPISAGPAVKISEGTVVVAGPADEEEARKAAERVEAANPPAQPAALPATTAPRLQTRFCGTVAAVPIHAHGLRCSRARRVYRANRRGELPDGWVCSASLARCFKGEFGSRHYFWWKRTSY